MLGELSRANGPPKSPPSEEAAFARQDHFSAGGAPQQYLPHMAKAFVFLGYSHEWKSEAVAQAARDLARAGCRIHEPKPAAPRSLSVRIASRGPLSEAFAQAVRASWMLPLRVQSGCLPSERQLPRERMREDAVTGGRKRGARREAREHLAAGSTRERLHARDHLAGGSRVARKLRKAPRWVARDTAGDGAPESVRMGEIVPVGSQGRVSRISREVRLGCPDGKRPIGLEIASLGHGEPGRFSKLAEVSRSWSRQASGAPQRIRSWSRQASGRLRQGIGVSSAYPRRIVARLSVSSPQDLGAEGTKAAAPILIEGSADDGPGRQEPREEGAPFDPRRFRSEKPRRFRSGLPFRSGNWHVWTGAHARCVIGGICSFRICIWGNWLVLAEMRGDVHSRCVLGGRNFRSGIIISQR